MTIKIRRSSGHDCRHLIRRTSRIGETPAFAHRWTARTRAAPSRRLAPLAHALEKRGVECVAIFA
jgi:hypothetical protein